MLNKKGFTLIELLAVIAILAILIVLAVPNILNIFNDSKKNAFIVQSQSIFKTAETQYISKRISPAGAPSSFCNTEAATSSDAALDIDATSDVKYSVKFNNDGKITSFYITDGTYSVSLAAAANTTYTVNNISDVDSTTWAGTACD